MRNELEIEKFEKMKKKIQKKQIKMIFPENLEILIEL